MRVSNVGGLGKTLLVELRSEEGESYFDEGMSGAGRGAGAGRDLQYRQEHFSRANCMCTGSETGSNEEKGSVARGESEGGACRVA